MPGRKKLVWPAWRRKGNRWALALLCILTPAVMGGCPEFRNESINAIETATRGVINAALTLLFDQYRSDDAL